MAEFVSRNKAAEFSLEALRSTDGRSGLLCISPSTWTLAYSLVAHYGYWRSRYYKLDVDGNMLELDDSEWEEVTDIVDLAIEELSMTGCDQIIEQTTRIADVLEKWYDKSFVNLDDIVDVVGQDSTLAKWLDAYTELKDAIEVILPSDDNDPQKSVIPIERGIQFAADSTFKLIMTEKMNDIIGALYAQVIATNGPNAGVILNLIKDVLPADDIPDILLGDTDETVINLASLVLTTLTGNYTTNRLANIRDVLAECCEQQTQVNVTINQSAPHTGTISTGGEEDQFPDQETYFNAKCSAANGIYDTVKAAIDDLNNTDLEQMKSGVAGGLIAQLSYKLTKSDPMGWAISKVSSFVTGIAMTLLNDEPSFSNISSALSEKHSALVLALYNASDTTTAKSSFLSVLGQATTSLTATETGLVTDLLTNDLLNQLFSPRSDTVSYQSSNAIDCGSSGTVWTFPTDGEGWTFRDDSTGGTASGQWSSGDEGWLIDLDPQGSVARGVIYINGLSIAVDVGNSVQFDFSQPSDGGYSTIRLKVIYSDLTESDGVIGSINSAGTIILDIPEAKTIETIECMVGRSHTSSNNPYSQVIQEVRVQ